VGLFGKMVIMGKRKVTCEYCLQTFCPEWSEQESLQEKERNFGGMPLEECALLCTNCFVKVMLHAESIGEYADQSWRKGYEDVINEVLCQKKQ